MKNTLLVLIVLAGFSFPSLSFATIYGVPSGCQWYSTYLSGDSVGTVGGSWASSNPSVATVVPVSLATCKVNAITAGTTTITYSGPSGISTVVFTVHPDVPPIVGAGTNICIGATTTYTDPTGGGTWSSTSPGIAMVGAATGVITGVSEGGTFISYTLPTGCFSFASVIVLGPPVVDSVGGWPTICPGSSAPYTCSTFPGGVWASSNTSVATVGSSSGVVTGISIGTAIISYTGTGTCGSNTGTSTVTVTTTISAGSIIGLPTISVGGSTFYYSTLTGGGGTWSSSNPSVATVTTTGYVAGLATGTSIISYTITSGTCAPAHATMMVTVASPDCISGYVTFAGAPIYGYTGYFKVWLIKYNPTTHLLTAADSLNVYSSGPGYSTDYSFCGLGTDSFRVKAGFSTIAAGTGYIPTYHLSSTYWNTATVIPHLSGTNDINKNIIVGYGTTTAGPGFIAGDVTTGANKGTADGSPVPGMLVFCVDNTTNTIVQQAITDAAGHYSFSALQVGVPYKIYPEDINYATTPYPSITLTSGSTSMIAANFIQHTISYTITPVLVGLHGVATSNKSTINVFPNPTNGALNIQWDLVDPGEATAIITDVTGRQVLSTSIDMVQNTGTALINLNSIYKGLYIVTIRANGVNYFSKIIVQ